MASSQSTDMKQLIFLVLSMTSLISSEHGESGANLSRTAASLAMSKKLTIGYFGGSLTDGYGASNMEKTSWRARTTEWFCRRFPDVSIQEINAAIGGTGSHLGVYRIGMDLLKQKPDLVFVEFAVNDATADPQRTVRSMEGIVRQIWRANPMADIVFVYTTRSTFEPYHVAGQLPPSVMVHKSVAKHYGISEVNAGQSLWEEIRSGRMTWDQAMPDRVHPKDSGYAAYSEAVIRFLEAQDWSKKSTLPVSLPVLLDSNALQGAVCVDARDVAGAAWQSEDRRVGRYPHCVSASEPGTELVYKFNGTAIGLYWLSSADAGDVEWSIDDSAPKRESSWTPYVAKSPMGTSVIFSDQLRPGEHVLKLRILAEKNARSTGTFIRIAALLVNKTITP